MFSHATAGRVSVVFSLALIVAVVCAFVDKIDQQPSIVPAAVPSDDKTTAPPVLAQQRVLATIPMVLPPPPAPAPQRASKDLIAEGKETPDSTEAEQNPPPIREIQSKDPGLVELSAGASAKAPLPQKPKSEPDVGRKPPPRAQPEKSEQPSRSTPSRLAPQVTATEAPRKSIVASQSNDAEGRTLLRLLEHGSGPIVELAWPDGARHRERLYARLVQCFGMQVALMGADDRLYVADGRPNTPWNLNLDRFSGFIREPAGTLSREERQAADRIRAQHNALVSASLVRVFPRTVDARLLGGLRQLLGEHYASVQSIRARYKLSGSRLVVEQIVADGRRIQGTLELPPVASGVCRRQAET
jgi:hypothetical protein